MGCLYKAFFEDFFKEIHKTMEFIFLEYDQWPNFDFTFFFKMMTMTWHELVGVFLQNTCHFCHLSPCRVIFI